MSGYGEGKGVSYNSYLKVKELKELQLCLSDPAHHDEPLFIFAEWLLVTSFHAVPAAIEGTIRTTTN